MNTPPFASNASIKLIKTSRLSKKRKQIKQQQNRDQICNK